MKSITYHTGTLTVVSRLPGSRYGNPRYLLNVGGYCTFRTAVDSPHGYSVPSYDGRQVEVAIGIHYGSATLNSIKLLG